MKQKATKFCSYNYDHNLSHGFEIISISLTFGTHDITIPFDEMYLVFTKMVNSHYTVFLTISEVQNEDASGHKSRFQWFLAHLSRRLIGELLVMSPQPKGGGDILFLVRIPLASASASALLRFRALSFEPMDGF